MSTTPLLQNYGSTDNRQLNVDNRDGLKQKALKDTEERLESRENDLERAIYEVSKATFYNGHGDYEPKLEKLLGKVTENRPGLVKAQRKRTLRGLIKKLITTEENRPKDFKTFYQTVDEVEYLERTAESFADEMKGAKNCIIAVCILLPVIGWIWAFPFYFYNYSKKMENLINLISNERVNLAKLKKRPHFQNVLTILKNRDSDFQKINKEIRAIRNLLDPPNDPLANPQTARPQKKEESTGSMYDRLTRSQKNSSERDFFLGRDVRLLREEHPRSQEI